MKYYTESDLENLNKKDLQELILELQKKCEELSISYDNLDEAYAELEDVDYDNANQIEELESELEYNSNLVDIDNLKEKLELYDLYSEPLWNFFDLYMKLYNESGYDYE